MLLLVAQVRQDGIDFFAELDDLMANVSSEAEMKSSVLWSCEPLMMFIRLNGAPIASNQY